MYRHTQNQLEFENFGLPFSGKLRSDNRWVKLSKIILWGEFEKNYAKSLKGSGFGPPAKSVRVALGSLIIKERLGTSDTETVDQIRENPYLQYFLGFKEYKDEEPFHKTMLVHFRKRITREMLNKVNEAIHKRSRSKDDNDDDQPPVNKGKLLIDATCASADITFPTDLKLLNKAREKTEQIIDILHKPHIGKKKKPRTYRRTARKDFLSVAKAKNLSKSKRRKANRKQLGYVERNLKTISELVKESSLTLLSRTQYKDLFVVNELFPYALTAKKSEMTKDTGIKLKLISRDILRLSLVMVFVRNVLKYISQIWTYMIIEYRAGNFCARKINGKSL